MVGMAVWLQTVDVSKDWIKILGITVTLIAIAMVAQAIAVVVISTRVLAILKDVKASFDETKGKALPILAKVHELTNTTQGIVGDLAPKIKVLSANVVETSHSVRQTATKLEVTIRDVADKAAVTFDDANRRTAVQVAKVDGMVASTLSATAELGATVNEGIRVPARKIAALVTQTKHVIDTLIDRAKAAGINIGNIVDSKVHPKGPATKL